MATDRGRFRAGGSGDRGGGVVVGKRWQPGMICLSLQSAPVWREGKICNSVGMYKIHSRGSLWSLTHLPTGHNIVQIRAAEVYAFMIADEIERLTDWDFDWLYGWRNRCPDLPDLVRSVADRYADAVLPRDWSSKGNPEMARAVFDAREARR